MNAVRILAAVLLCAWGSAAFCADRSIWGDNVHGEAIIDELDRMKAEIADAEERLKQLEDDIQHFAAEAERTRDNSYVAAHNDALAEYNALWRRYQDMIGEHNHLAEAYNDMYAE